MIMRVSDYIVQFLYEYGVEDYFLLSGGGIMHLTDGLASNRNIKVYCFHHEQAASMALEAYAKLNSFFGVGYFTTGPGATNTITGLAGAYLDSIPCLFISGQVKNQDSVYKAAIPGIRQIGVQEINILPIVQSITKYAGFVDNPEEIRFHLEKAIYLAKTGRPGPSWLDIPLDVQSAKVDITKLKPFTPEPVNIEISDQSIQKVVQILQKSLRPVFLVGQGVRLGGAIASLLKFIEKYKIPVVTSFLGIDIMDSFHPQYIGRIGIKGDRAGNFAMQNSDVLIIIGSSLPIAEIGYEYDMFAPEAKKIVVDIDISSHKKKTFKIDMLIEGDAKDFLNKIFEVSDKKLNSCSSFWVNKCLQWKEKYPVCLPEYKDLKDRINIYYFVDSLCKKLTTNDVIVTDAGSAFYAGSQAIKIHHGIRYITSGGFASMGYSLPASIGACIANNKQRIMCINGDGSFQQNIQELQTIVHYQLPIKIFILNNEGYLSIRFTQSRYFSNRFIGEGPNSGVSFPETEKIAYAYGIKFFKAYSNTVLDEILEQVISYNGPVLCEIMCPRDQLIIPTTSSAINEKGQMVSKPLEDLYPFLDRDIFGKEMIIKHKKRD